MINKEESRLPIILNIVFSVLGLLLNIGINMILTPFITNNVGVAAYGFISLANTIVGYIEIISIALNSLASRYMAIEYHNKDYIKANKIYNSVLISDIILSIIIFLGSILYIKNLEYFLNIPKSLLSDVRILFYLVVFNYILLTISTCFNVAVFIKNRLDLSSAVKNISYLIKAITLYVIFSIFSPHIWQVMIATIISTLFILILNIYFTKKLTPKLKINPKKFSIKIVKEITLNGIWNSISSLGVMLNSGLDLLITNMFLNAIAMGQLSISKNFAAIFNNFVSVFTQAFRPTQLKAYCMGDFKKLINEFNISMKITASFCSIVFAGMVSLGYAFLNIWVPKQDITLIYNILLIILIGDVIGSITYPLTYTFIIVNKLKIPSLINIFNGIINVLSMVFLLKFTELGLYAIVITTAFLNIIIQFLIIPPLSCRYLGLSKKTFYPTTFRCIINCIFLTLIFSIIRIYFRNIDSWIKLIYSVVILGVIGIIISYFILFTSYERKQLLKKIKNKL